MRGTVSKFPTILHILLTLALMSSPDAKMIVKSLTAASTAGGNRGVHHQSRMGVTWLYGPLRAI